MIGPGRPRRRLDRRHKLRHEEALLRPAYKVWGYKNPFAKGFVIARGFDTSSVPRGWKQFGFGGYSVALEPSLEHSAAGDGDVQVLLLGHAFDDRGARKRAQVAGRILRAARVRSPIGSLSSLEEYVTWLSGRYVVLVRRGARLDVWNDPLASKSVYFRSSASGVGLASHSALLADLAGGLPSSHLRWVLAHPDYKSPSGKWLPGLITPHDEVGQLYANARLTVEGNNVVHERFFPRADRVELTPRDAAARFAEDLRQQVRNWIAVAPLTVLTLTAGRDSRAVLEAALPDLQRARAIALTYHPFHVPQKSTASDLAVGNRLALAAGLRHLSVNVSPMSDGSPFAALYRETFPTWHRYPALASALYLQAPAKAATLFAIGGAIITGMYKDTSAPEPTPEVLAAKYAQSKFAEDPELLAEMARWMDFTDFSHESMRGYDFHDFFHWEHRMTKWAGAGYAEYDLATIPAPVLSSRRLLVAALSLPKPLRVDALVYRSITEGESALT